MDANRFDTFARSLRALPSRRALLGLGLSGVVSLLGADGVDAKKHRKRRCKGCRECERCRKGKCKPKPNGKACGEDKSCQDGVCGEVCSCTAPAICDGPDGKCCDPEGTPCTSFGTCCSQECDFLVGGGTCGSCRGLYCDADYRCCGGYDCIKSRCDGCLDRAIVCTPSDSCCFSECTNGVCLSAEGGRCAHDADCESCYMGGDCENACVDGSCAFRTDRSTRGGHQG